MGPLQTSDTESLLSGPSRDDFPPLWRRGVPPTPPLESAEPPDFPLPATSLSDEGGEQISVFCVIFSGKDYDELSCVRVDAIPISEETTPRSLVNDFLRSRIESVTEDSSPPRRSNITSWSFFRGLHRIDDTVSIFQYCSAPGLWFVRISVCYEMELTITDRSRHCHSPSHRCWIPEETKLMSLSRMLQRLRHGMFPSELQTNRGKYLPFCRTVESSGAIFEDIPRPRLEDREELENQFMDHPLKKFVQQAAIGGSHVFRVDGWVPFQPWEDRQVPLNWDCHVGTGVSHLTLSSTQTMADVADILQTEEYCFDQGTYRLFYRDELLYEVGNPSIDPTKSFDQLFIQDPVLKLVEIDSPLKNHSSLVKYVPNRRSPGEEHSWHAYEADGLSVEGVCDREDCEAHEENVVAPLGSLTQFDILSPPGCSPQADLCQCHCGNRIAQIRHLVASNVQYRFLGIRKDDGAILRTPWLETPDDSPKLHLIVRREIDGLCSRLSVFMRPKIQAGSSCMLCRQTKWFRTIQNHFCGCSLHRECLEMLNEQVDADWTKVCPLCGAKK